MLPCSCESAGLEMTHKWCVLMCAKHSSPAWVQHEATLMFDVTRPIEFFSKRKNVTEQNALVRSANIRVFMTSSNTSFFQRTNEPWTWPITILEWDGLETECGYWSFHLALTTTDCSLARSEKAQGRSSRVRLVIEPDQRRWIFRNYFWHLPINELSRKSQKSQSTRDRSLSCHTINSSIASKYQ